MSLAVRSPPFSFDLTTAAQLRAALRTSLDGAEFFGGPLVLVGREVDIPAWSWLGQVCLLRSDWLPAVAAAMHDALHHGTELERQALVDALANEPATVRLLPWTAGWARMFGDVTGTRSGTGWGGSSTAPRLDHVLANHERYAEAWVRQPHDVLWRLRPVALATRDHLRNLLERTARTGRGPETPLGDHGWDWLAQQVAYVPWIADALGELLPWALHGEPAHGYAALDYLLMGQDAWRWRDLVRQWRSHPPNWAATPTKVKPKGWGRKARQTQDNSLKTWADLALRFETLHGRQAPPVMDLPLP
ncbi:MAG: hypothetical protein FJ100_01985 [Deltaproteobacteria bacterium]|nr:hypothetical protein [Deltaproteobacteria bacterium]